MKTDKWQNKDKEGKDDKGKDKKSPARSRKVAGKPHRYKLTEEGVSKEGFGLGSEVYGVREGAGEYKPSKEASQEREDSTRLIDSTRYLETAIKTYSEVSEILAVFVAKTIEALIEKNPPDIDITSEWICKIHNDIAGSLFHDWAGKFRDVNVQVGTHIPPPYFEVPVYMRLYCEDLAARLLTLREQRDIEKISESLAYADWRFQWIHPFKDFNGRVGRILLTALLFKLRLPPAETASVDRAGKERYIRALHDADAGDLSLPTEIWIERLSKAFNE
ncbi:Fic family protein [Dissulfurispira sp.]|uniref:Fic family protein n=1 Tax=Dissulfurispira sp. TaxID=2817609 RepID=UPI002FD8B380